MSNRETIIKYVRDRKGPKGVVLATKTSDGVYRLGWSLCRKGDKFNKKFGVQIAKGRATAGCTEFPSSLKSDINEIEERASRYFKDCQQKG